MKKLYLILIMVLIAPALFAQLAKTAQVNDPGTLSAVLTTDELLGVTDLTVTGVIDARDFKTMRDLMPVLANLDLSGATIVEYNGGEGTSNYGHNNYLANAIPEFAFCNSSWQGKQSLTSIVFPNSLTLIGQNAFMYCSGLVSVLIPEGVTSISDVAFYRCDNLSSIPIPTTVNSIGNSAFGHCRGLNSIFIPEGVSSLGDAAFVGCICLINVDDNNPNYCDIDGVLYNKNQTTIMQCPASKTGNFDIPNTVTSIGNNAFQSCEGLTSIVIPKGVTSIGSYAFYHCSGLTSVVIPEGVTSINNEAFADCSSLTSIYAYSIIPVSLSNSPDVFARINMSCTLYVPYGTKAAYQEANQWKEFQNILEMPEIEKTYIPDDNFEQALIDLGYDSGALDDYVPTANISTITNLNVDGKNISYFTGIEDFISLKELYCQYNKLSVLNVSNNILLERLACRGNQLDILDLTKNSKLNMLDCMNNKLQSINVTNLANLAGIWCNNNELLNIDVSTNTGLFHLICGENKLTVLDLSTNLNLVDLSCQNNQLSLLDLSKQKNLRSLMCNDNQLVYLNIQNGNNSNMPVNEWYNVHLHNNPGLFCIKVDNPVLAATYTSWKKDAWASYTTDSDCSAYKTYVPDDNFEQALIALGYDSGPLDDYVLTSNISSVYALTVSNKNIADLTGIEGFSKLIYLNCSSNKLTKLDVSKNTELTNLTCNSNLLSSLDVSNNTSLKILSCNSNQLTALDVSNNTALLELWCYFNQLTSLNVSNNLSLTKLACFTNKLSALDVSKNTSLTTLNCLLNRLTNLNIQNGNNANMNDMNATNNPNLTCIQVDDPVLSGTNTNWKKDVIASYSLDCTPPVANAGADQTVNENTEVTLDGSASVDPNGTDLDYSWTAPEGMTLSGENTVNLSFTAPEVTTDTELTFTLTVTDIGGNTSSDEVRVTVLQVNKAPIANAGNDMTVKEGAIVQLNGSASYDPDGDHLTYTWTAPAGIVLNGENTAAPTFLVPKSKTEMQYVFSLTVSDGTLVSATDDILITALRTANQPPVIQCNNISVTLNSNGSYTLTAADLSNLAAGTTDDNDLFSKLIIEAVPSVFYCSDIAVPVQVKVTVTDSNNEFSTCNATVTVSDVIPPLFASTPKNISIAINQGETYFLPDLSVTYKATDGCSQVTYLQTPAAGTPYLNATKETVTLKASDEYGNSSELKFSVTVSVKNKLKSADISIAEKQADVIKTEVYPNPTNGIVNIGTSSKNVDIEVLTSSGVLVLKKQFNEAPAQVDLSQYVEGIYFIKINSAEEQGIFKILLKK